MQPISAAVRFRTTLAGAPSSSTPSGPAYPPGTTAPAPAMVLVAITAPSRTIAPMPIRQLLPDGAPMDDGVVSHRDAVADLYWIARQGRATTDEVLNVGPRADFDLGVIAANDGTEPNAGLSADFYVAYDMCAWLHINVAVQAGHRPAQLADTRSLRWSAQVSRAYGKNAITSDTILGYTLLTYASRPGGGWGERHRRQHVHGQTFPPHAAKAAG